MKRDCCCFVFFWRLRGLSKCDSYINNGIYYNCVRMWFKVLGVNRIVFLRGRGLIGNIRG